VSQTQATECAHCGHRWEEGERRGAAKIDGKTYEVCTNLHGDYRYPCIVGLMVMVNEELGERRA